MIRRLLIVLGIVMLSACSSTLTKEPNESVSVTEIREQQLLENFVSSTEQQLQQMSVVQENKYIRYEKAKLLYMLVMQTASWERNKEAQQLFEPLLSDADFVRPAYRHAELKAYYGSLYTLKGRDMPGWWWVNNMTPVGLVRIYYVNKGVGILNQAVELDAKHPVVRLIRGNTFSQLPAFAGTKKEGLEDLSLLLSWLEAKESKSSYQAILQDRTFRLSAYFNIAQVFEQHQIHGKARTAYEAIVRLAPESVEAQIASLAIASINSKLKDES